MSTIGELLDHFDVIASNPKAQLEKYVGEGKKAIGCFPYYVPEELVRAAGMVPFGIWGAEGTINAAKEYFAPFYCTIAQMGLELALNGKLNKLSGVIMPSMCDTLRPLTQNFRAAIPQVPFIFLAHPQNRRAPYGVEYTKSQYSNVKKNLESIAGKAISDNSLKEAIRVYNESRAARRKFVKLAGQHPESVSPVQRSAVLKSAYFMDKAEHTALLTQLNAQLEALPKSDWKGAKILISGILADSKNLLQILGDNHMAVVADDVAQQSRAFRLDVPEADDPMTALALQFAGQDYDVLLYDPELNKRPEYVVNLAKENGAQGVVILMMQFCDPEEMEYPSLKQALDKAGIPSVSIGFDQQMRDFGQARTQLQAFADVLNAKH
ncbi:MAG: 2-hydroxyacyl-CoA dehydratase family protein [Synergistaceae bacterium]|nr:2-hydroxyacyl-CoA dehydratase family protein [Synergistaceae bacterium]